MISHFVSLRPPLQSTLGSLPASMPAAILRSNLGSDFGSNLCASRFGYEERILLPFEPQDQYLQRQKKLAEIEARGHEAYPHKFEWTATRADLVEKYAAADAATL